MELETIHFVINIDDLETGLQRTSLVVKPAIGETFELFDDVSTELFEANQEERIITGPVMIPDKKILRKYKDNSGYYHCVFSKESILNTVKKASKYNKFNELNLKHSKNPEDQVNGVYLIESMILNDRNKSELFKDLPDGTWIASFWVEDEDYWNEVIKGEKFTGFSVEVNVERKTEEAIKKETQAFIESILDDENLSREDKQLKIKSALNIQNAQ